MITESPRWLLAHGKKDKAIASLNRIRSKHDVQTGVTLMEIEAIEQSIEEADSTQGGSWKDLSVSLTWTTDYIRSLLLTARFRFRGTYLRRAMVGICYHRYDHKVNRDRSLNGYSYSNKQLVGSL